MQSEHSEKHSKASDNRTVQSALNILVNPAGTNRLTRLLPFLGPAFIASVAYVDPGNFATNIQAGAQFGYMLIWVIVVSNLMAMLIQTLSAKLGLVTGKNLAEHCREQFPRPVVLVMWGVMELVAIATDLAEFLGAALGFNLLLGVPLLIGALLTGVATLLILGLERYGFRPLEAVISGMVGMIALCYLVETILDKSAQAHNADLIVLATHGKSGMDAFLAGSFSHKLCSLCTTPLLLIPVENNLSFDCK